MPRTPPSKPSFLDPPAVRAHEPRIRDAHLKLLWRSVVLDGSSTLRADGVPSEIAARAASSPLELSRAAGALTLDFHSHQMLHFAGLWVACVAIADGTSANWVVC